MESCELAAFITSLACAIAKNQSPEELAVLISVLGQLSATLATILASEAAKSGTDSLVI